MYGITTCPQCGGNLRGSEQIQDRVGISPLCNAHLDSPILRIAEEDAERNLEVRRNRVSALLIALLIVLGIPVAIVIIAWISCAMTPIRLR
jgi:hypothetical protein